MTWVGGQFNSIKMIERMLTRHKAGLCRDEDISSRDNDLVSASYWDPAQSRRKKKKQLVRERLDEGVCWQNACVLKQTSIYTFFSDEFDLQHFGSFRQGGDWENVVR